MGRDVFSARRLRGATQRSPGRSLRAAIGAVSAGYLSRVFALAQAWNRSHTSDRGRQSVDTRVLGQLIAFVCARQSRCRRVRARMAWPTAPGAWWFCRKVVGRFLRRGPPRPRSWSARWRALLAGVEIAIFASLALRFIHCTARALRGFLDRRAPQGGAPVRGTGRAKPSLRASPAPAGGVSWARARRPWPCSAQAPSRWPQPQSPAPWGGWSRGGCRARPAVVGGDGGG